MDILITKKKKLRRNVFFFSQEANLLTDKAQGVLKDKQNN
jgi:hypothetical protein